MTDDIDPRFLAIIKRLEDKYDDNDRTWAEGAEHIEELPVSVRMSALETARLHWSFKAKRIARANTKKAREDRRG